MKARKTILPGSSLISEYLPCDHADAYAVDVPETANFSADDMQIMFWTKSPAWVERMMKLRNILVRPLGLQVDKPNLETIRRAIEEGGHCGVMTVVAKSANETLIKLDDKHLTAYISVIVEPRRAIAVTVVHFKNLLGRVYFTVIASFHHIIVRRMLKSSVMNCLEKQESRHGV